MVEWILWEILFEAGKRRETFYYSEVVKELQKRKISIGKGRLAYRKLVGYLHRVCFYTYNNWKILPGSIIVTKKDKIPSIGYFKFLNQLGVCKGTDLSAWEREKRRFYEFCRNF
ncbi:hypothetical protein SAMN06265339_0817 [Desulfurobacterium pacificum]|uniref:Uncharacterized protein n=1 Tax=Desulfurobacterium pacificum TaxID=240166 RepID=A0ABY1NIX8_9BACT|nr:hypothetical protein [Desulfurobacterium pacificum]SMP10509.1 hypothetical protein SAMN06265339_0817 [Desulfurobacterium pacificum]